MRMRLDATMRSPASSSIFVTAPVRFRRVASGLMIEKVRVAAMTGRPPVISGVGIRCAPSRAGPSPQGPGLLHPLAALLRPVTTLHPFPARKELPWQPRSFECFGTEQIETAVVVERRVAPLAIGNEHVSCEVRSVGTLRQEDRLPRIIGTTSETMR